MIDNDKPPVVDLAVLRGGGAKDQRAEMMRNVEAGWDGEVKMAAMLAKIKKMQFDAYVAAGFSPQQALELVK